MVQPQTQANVTCYKHDYIGNIEYQNNQLEAYYTEEGRINYAQSSRHEYNLTDHLGNTRVCFTPNPSNPTSTLPKILQQTNYYAYGLPIGNLSRTYPLSGTMALEEKYQYNQKELNSDFGLLWSDYGARWLDLQRGVWGQIDPLAEKYAAWSGYNYVAGNPISYTDPTGKARTYFVDQQGNHLYTSNDNKADAITIVDNMFTFNIGLNHNLGIDYLRSKLVGTTYDFKSIANFNNRSKTAKDQGDEFFEKNAQGKFVPANIEIGNYLYVNEGVAYVGGDASRDLIGTPTQTTFDRRGNGVTRVHFHPDNNRRKDIYKRNEGGKIQFHVTAIGELGPSIEADLIRHNTVDGYYNLVTGANDKGGYSAYFYGAGKGVIEVPLNIFDNSKK